MCVCVCEREREREREKAGRRGHFIVCPKPVNELKGTCNKIKEVIIIIMFKHQILLYIPVDKLNNNYMYYLVRES